MYSFYNQSEINEILEAIAKKKEEMGVQYGVAVDCETYGKNPNCVVFNLAAHVFTFDPRLMDQIPLDGLPISKNYRFSVSEQTELGRKIEDDTWEWWCSPDRREAYEEIAKIKRVNFVEGMIDFNDWLKEIKDKLKCRVYYRGQDFDYPIVKSLLETAGMKQEFVRGDAPRDTRSYIDAKVDGNTGFIPGNKPNTELHTALGDVVNDIRQLQLAWCLSNNVDLSDFVKIY